MTHQLLLAASAAPAPYEEAVGAYKAEGKLKAAIVQQQAELRRCCAVGWVLVCAPVVLCSGGVVQCVCGVCAVYVLLTRI